jgi:hypothetical protein
MITGANSTFCSLFSFLVSRLVPRVPGIKQSSYLEIHGGKYTPHGDVIHNWPYAARKRTGDAESGWRPPPDKNIEPVPYWGKN